GAALSRSAGTAGPLGSGPGRVGLPPRPAAGASRRALCPGRRRHSPFHRRRAAARVWSRHAIRDPLMTALLAIAGNTVRELMRGKLLYNLLLFAALFVAGSLLVAQLTVGNWMRIILDMGLGAMEVAGVLLAIVIGVGIVAGEVQRKTILPTLAKPLPRWTFCVGRYAGLVFLLTLNAAV